MSNIPEPVHEFERYGIKEVEFYPHYYHGCYYKILNFLNYVRSRMNPVRTRQSIHKVL